MGSVYRRKDSKLWWIAFRDETGKRRLLSSGSEDEAFAQKLLASCERKVAAIRNAGVATEAMPTVSAYAEKWLEQRVRRGLSSASDDRTRIERHALPRIGSLRMDEVRRKHLRSMMVELEIDGKLAPRSRRHVYYLLRTMFADAVADELITSSPCTLTKARKELPPVQDADPTWRRTAVFSREEIRSLVLDKRIPEYRRVRYAVEFLAGIRINELTPRIWADWVRDERPLSKLLIHSGYQPKLKKVRPTTKTGVAREMPVHPVLALILDAWWSGGWERFQGRPPTEEDLIMPAIAGGFMSSSSAWKRLQEDLALLGYRGRRQHDARRTFISLARADGAFSDKLRIATHGESGDIMDVYTTLPWSTLCEEVAKFQPFPAGTPATSLLRHPQPSEITIETTWRRRESKARPAPSSASVLPAVRSVTEGSEVSSLPGVTQYPSPTVADVADPGGYERLARREGFYVSPPLDQIH